MKETHEFWMKKAIVAAQESKTPYGAIIVNSKGEFIEAFNTVKTDGPIAHAEINVIQKLKKMQAEKKEELILYSTVEPCPMCMSAIIWAGIGTIIYGADIPFAAKYGNQINIRANEIINNSWRNTILIQGVLAKECEILFTIK
ncbi:MAG: tRNA(adenine34) deaminase [Flavobacterium sp.]|jgi:tRNA(adenine34) deaminase